MRIRIQQLKLMRIHANPDPDTNPDPQPCLEELCKSLLQTYCIVYFTSKFVIYGTCFMVESGSGISFPEFLIRHRFAFLDTDTHIVSPKPTLPFQARQNWPLKNKNVSCQTTRGSNKSYIFAGLWIRNDLFRIRFRIRIRLLKEISALNPDPTPDPDPVSDPATLVSASRELSSKLALYS